jgi:hypothetical protein
MITLDGSYKSVQWLLMESSAEQALPLFDDNSIDALVTDPPSGIGFMGKEWDSDKGGRIPWIAWLTGIMRECYRVMKPGAHGLVWALPRTSHWTMTALENAGFEIRDRINHLFLNGFPKSKKADLALDQTLGATGRNLRTGTEMLTCSEVGRISKNLRCTACAKPFMSADPCLCPRGYEPGSEIAATWGGWGTALKPAAEDWILIRKPLEGTLGSNLLKWGTGALNIDATRIGDGSGGAGAGTTCTYAPGPCQGHDNALYGRTFHRVKTRAKHEASAPSRYPSEPGDFSMLPGPRDGSPDGRWPAHVILDHQVVIELPEFSRYFYVPKPSTKEREAGLDDLPLLTGGQLTERVDGTDGLNNPRAGAGRGGNRRNHHPTIKSIELMRYLCRLITPPGGTVLDTFAGSCSGMIAAALEEFHAIGIEQEPDYVTIGACRLAHWLG